MSYTFKKFDMNMKTYIFMSNFLRVYDIFSTTTSAMRLGPRDDTHNEPKDIHKCTN